jgi:hypothetical protein
MIARSRAVSVASAFRLEAVRWFVVFERLSGLQKRSNHAHTRAQLSLTRLGPSDRTRLVRTSSSAERFLSFCLTTDHPRSSHSPLAIAEKSSPRRLLSNHARWSGLRCTPRLLIVRAFGSACIQRDRERRFVMVCRGEPAVAIACDCVRPLGSRGRCTVCSRRCRRCTDALAISDLIRR